MNKCKDCKHLSGKTSSIGRLCTVNKHWSTPTAMWKQPSGRACKRYFERKDDEE